MNEMEFCQSCGMPLTGDCLGTNADGSKNEEYCIYCYKDGAFTADYSMEEMAEHCSMFVAEYNKNTGKNLTACEYKQELLKVFPSLKRWNMPSDQIPHADNPFKKVLIEEVNALGIQDLHIDNLYVMQGSFINQAYQINGNEVKLLDDNVTYWTNQVIRENARCYGVACNEFYILVSQYDKDGANAELVMLKKRC